MSYKSKRATQSKRITVGVPHSALRTPRSTQIVPLMLSWFATHARDLPWRRTRDPYAIWVSEIMLQQTQVKTVIPYWKRWMRELPTIESLAKAKPAKIHKLWEGLGYYTRVRNLQKAAQQIITACRSRGDESHTKTQLEPPQVVSYKFPESFDAVLALPGIGRYTAGAICSIAFNQPTPILDGNVIRVLTRIYGISTDPREKQTNAHLWQLAEELVIHASRLANQAQPCSHLNQSLMELGALICTPRSPNCTACPAQKLCVARRRNLQDQLPNLGKREAATKRRFLAFVVERDGKFLVRQRPDGVVNAHLWEFPNVEVGAQVRDPQHMAARESGFKTTETSSLCTIKHSITRYRITLEAWRAELTSANGAPVSDTVRSKRTLKDGPDRKPALQGAWRTPAQLHRLAFTSAHKKILTHLEERC